MELRGLLSLLFFGTVALSAQDSSNANPPVSAADIRIVQRAREILDSPAKWNRSDNRNCPEGQQIYSLYCALEKASEEVSKNFEHREAVMQQARFAIDEVLAKGNRYQHRLMDYNNDPKTTFADVQRFFTILEERVRQKLAAQSHQ
jgi:hypothetical protein